MCNLIRPNRRFYKPQALLKPECHALTRRSAIAYSPWRIHLTKVALSLDFQSPQTSSAPTRKPFTAPAAAPPGVKNMTAKSDPAIVQNAKIRILLNMLTPPLLSRLTTDRELLYGFGLCAMLTTI